MTSFSVKFSITPSYPFLRFPFASPPLDLSDSIAVVYHLLFFFFLCQFAAKSLTEVLRSLSPNGRAVKP